MTSNTDAAQLAETFAEANCATKVFNMWILYDAIYEILQRTVSHIMGVSLSGFFLKIFSIAVLYLASCINLLEYYFALLQSYHLNFYEFLR